MRHFRHQVRLGEWNTKTEIDCLQIKGYTECNDPAVDVRIEEVIPYDQNNRDYKVNDIALLRLAQDVDFTDFIKPICLPSEESEKLNSRDHLVVSGWGVTENFTTSNLKLKLNVPIVQIDECSEKYQKSGVIISDSHLCAGGQRLRGTCQGDSGGPLVTTFRNDSGQWYIAGIVSFSAQCALHDWPTIYTKVFSYLPWIRENVRP